MNKISKIVEFLKEYSSDIDFMTEDELERLAIKILNSIDEE